MDNAREKELFEKSSVRSAVIRLALPTVIGQIILVIYNMADTFFVGLTGSDATLTAVTVCMPAFMFLSAISNLFGVGGASVIARALGTGDRERVRHTSAFALWGCLAVTAAYSLLACLARDLFIDLLGGAAPEVHWQAVEYLTCTVIAGGCVTSVGVLLSHLVRAEGRAVHASAGIALGGVLNIGLDPLFMFVIMPRGHEALGAAIATALANLATLVYFIVLHRAARTETSLRFRACRQMIGRRIPAEVFVAGLPACVMTLFENISYAVLDKLMSGFGLPMQAGIGVAKKVNMLAHSIVRGIAQGSLPLIAYNYSAGDYKRMRESFRMARSAAVMIASLCMFISLVLAEQLVSIFIRSGSTAAEYGAMFLRILSIGGPFSAAAYTVISYFQATGEGMRSFVLAILRKGVLDIPLMFLLNVLLPIYGIVSATPVADTACAVIAQILYSRYVNRLLLRLPRELTEEELLQLEHD